MVNGWPRLSVNSINWTDLLGNAGHVRLRHVDENFPFLKGLTSFYLTFYASLFGLLKGKEAKWNGLQINGVDWANFVRDACRQYVFEQLQTSKFTSLVEVDESLSDG